MPRKLRNMREDSNCCLVTYGRHWHPSETNHTAMLQKNWNVETCTNMDFSFVFNSYLSHSFLRKKYVIARKLCTKYYKKLDSMTSKTMMLTCSKCCINLNSNHKNTNHANLKREITSLHDRET